MGNRRSKTWEDDVIGLQQGWRSHRGKREINGGIDGEERGGATKRQREAGMSTGGPKAGRHLSHTSIVCVYVCVLLSDSVINEDVSVW